MHVITEVAQFMVTEDQVQVTRIFQDTSRASMVPPRPWMNVTEPPALGDFVQVNSSYNRGKEGCIEALGSNPNDEYTISLTSPQSAMPTVILESDILIEPPTVSKCFVAVLHVILIRPSRLPLLFALFLPKLPSTNAFTNLTLSAS